MLLVFFSQYIYFFFRYTFASQRKQKTKKKKEWRERKKSKRNVTLSTDPNNTFSISMTFFVSLPAGDVQRFQLYRNCLSWLSAFSRNEEWRKKNSVFHTQLILIFFWHFLCWFVHNGCVDNEREKRRKNRSK